MIILIDQHESYPILLRIVKFYLIRIMYHVGSTLHHINNIFVAIHRIVEWTSIKVRYNMKEYEIHDEQFGLLSCGPYGGVPYF